MADISVSDQAINWMESQMWGLHHVFWHSERRWDLISEQSRNWLRNQNRRRAARQEGVRGNGLDFLAMHRVMIRQLTARFPEVQPLLAAWNSPPLNPDDVVDPMPQNGRNRLFSANKIQGIQRVTNQLAGFASDDDLGLYIQTRFRPTQNDPANETPDLSAGVHNYLHERFTDEDSSIDIGNSRVNIFNQRFWKLHGWIDEVWTQFRSVKGLNDNDPTYRNALREAELHMSHDHDHLKAIEKQVEVPEELKRLFSIGSTQD